MRCGTRSAATVVFVEATALKDNSDGGKHLSKFASALGTHGQGCVRELLDGFGALVALGAFVFVGGHCANS